MDLGDMSGPPGWSQQLLVMPSLIAIDMRVWVAPHRQRWSLNHAVWDGLSQDTLAMHVGEEQPNPARHLVERALQHRWRSLYEEFVHLGPFDQTESM